MQAFTDLVGTAAVPAHAFDIAELMELTPALDTAMAAHDTADQASEALGTSGFTCSASLHC
jgi:hypothetical protein